MSKKKTAIDRAIAGLEADLVSMRTAYEAQTAALEAAISRLHSEQTRVPARRKTPGLIVEVPNGSLGTGGAR